MTIDQIFFIGFCVNKKYFKEFTKNDINPQIAAYKFEERLIQGLKMMDVNVLSITSLASSTFPKNSRIFFPSDNSDKVKTMFLVNLPLVKLLHRFLQTISYLSQWIKKTKKQKVICIYSAHTPYLLATYIIHLLYKIPFFVVVPDLPIHMRLNSKQSLLIKCLKKFDSKLINFLLKKASGIAVISQQMIQDQIEWQKLPHIVIEGICEETKEDSVHLINDNYFLYAGGLNELYGVKMLVDSFTRSTINADLWLCGRGDLESYVEEIAKKDSRIKYLGFIDPVELKQLQAGCKGMIITRDPNELYTKYTFPSKIIEYLASGVPVLSTRLIGIPDRYFDFLIPIEEYTAECIIENIQNVLSMDKKTLNERVNKGQEFVFNEKSPLSVGKKFVAFMENVLKVPLKNR